MKNFLIILFSGILLASCDPATDQIYKLKNAASKPISIVSVFESKDTIKQNIRVGSTFVIGADGGIGTAHSKNQDSIWTINYLSVRIDTTISRKDFKDPKEWNYTLDRKKSIETYELVIDDTDFQ